MIRNGRYILLSLAGLSWLSSGAVNVAAQTRTPGTRIDRFTATLAIDRVCRTTAKTLERIRGTVVHFTQHGSEPRQVK
jgi:hypothetical protein